MGNLICGLLLMASSISGIVTFYKTFRRRKENESAVWLLLLTVFTVLWAITYALFFLLPDENAALFFHQLRYATVMLSGWTIYLFLYQTLKHRMYAKHILALFMLLPLANTAVLLTNRYTGLFITYLGVVEHNGLRTPLYEYGPWFIVHCIFSYIPLFLGMVIIINQFFRLQAKHRVLVGLLFIGMVITAITTMIAVFDVLPYPIDLSPMVVQATQAIFYYTLFNSRSLDIVFASRNIIFENSNSVLLIMDTGGTIVDYNLKAKGIAERLGIKELLGVPADGFLERWKSTAQSHTLEEDSSIFSIVEDESDTHYQVQTYDILGKKGEAKGYYMEIKNIKPIMTLIHMLQDAAYYDHLTGLPNRNYFAKKSAELDKPEWYPLCIMVGDVNGLKYVNDTYGHVKGDELLKRISGILLSCSPPNALFFRTGGDEFVGLLPHTDARQAEHFIGSVEVCCQSTEDPELKRASIALGYKIKAASDERIDELIKKADYEMYTTKRDRRSSPR